MNEQNTKKKKYETIKVPAEIDTISCDGGQGALGHPKVYYSFGNKNFAACHYCSRIFIRENKDI